MKNIPVIAAAACRLMVLVGLGVGFLPDTPALALDPARRADSYSVQGWAVEQGLPSSKIRAITETHDGYLWIATAQGMARFDGMHFTVFSRITNPELGGGGFFAVVEAPDGTVWFGGDGGLFCWRAGHFEHFTTKDGLKDDYVRVLFLGRDGTVIVCTRTGFSFIRDGHLTTPGGVWKQVSTGARYYLERADGSILLGTSEKVWRVSGGQIEVYSAAEGLAGEGFSSLAETADGSVWIGHSRGLRRVFPDGRTEDYGETQGLGSQVVALQTDRDGNLWIGTIEGGLYRLAHGRIEAATYSEQFGTTPIRQIFEDREGGLWIATATGLFRLKDNISASIGIAQGLTRTSVSAVLETQDGSWWIGLMSGGVYRYNGTQAVPMAVPTKTRLDEVTSLAEAPAGTVWIGALSGLYRNAGGVTTNLYQHNQETAWQKQIEKQPGAILPGLAHRRVSAIAPDGEGAIWVATEGALYHGREGGFLVYTKANGLPGNTFKSVIRTHNGDIWVTAPPEGVACLHEGRWTNYLCGKIISSVPPRMVYEDTRGTIWITTDGGGINRFKNGHWRTFTTRDGLDDDFISGITEDNLNNLWIACPNGIMRIPLQQFDELDAGRRAMLQPRIVNQSDGLPSAEVNQIGSPNTYRTRDGRLLFATDRGVAVIQPGDLKINGTLLPMHIERFVINGTDVNPSGPLVIPPGNNDVQIHYTAISLLAAEKIRFKIRLSPLDRDWVDTGDRRDVRYAKLPPGNYTFQVTACNSDGVWNEVFIALGFTVQPHFYQTAWFLGLMVVTVGGAGFGIYRARVLQSRRRTAKLEGLVKERTRELQSAKEVAEKAVCAKNEVITNLKQAETTLAKSLSLLNATLESTTDGILVTDGHGKVTNFNEQFIVMWHFPHELAEAKNEQQLLTFAGGRLKDPEQFASGVGELYAHPERESFDVLECNDGRIFERFSKPQRMGEKIVGRVWSFRDVTERIKTERQIAESRNFLDRIINSISDPIFVKDQQYRSVLVNDAFCTLIGCKREDLLGQSTDDHARISESEANTFKAKDQFVLETGRENVNEENLTAADGTTHYLVTKKSLYVDEKGEKFIVGVTRDVTELKKIEREIIESRNFLDRIINSISDPIFVKDRQHRWVLINDEGCKFAGLSRPAILGKTVHDIFPKAEAGVFWAKDELVFSTGHENVNEESFTDASGNRHTIITKKNLYVDENGEQFVVGVIRDITERQQAEEALRKSEANYYSLVDQMPAGIFRKDKEGRYVFVNSWFCRFKGAKPEDILGKLPQELPAETLSGPDSQTPETAGLVAAGLQHHAAILQHGRQIQVEEEYRLADGKIAHHHVIKSPVFGPDGTVVGSQGILLDITQRKQVEEQLSYERDLLRALLENSPDHIYFKDAQSRFIKSSSAQARQFGLVAADEMVGKSDFDFFTEDHARPAFEDEQKIIRTGEPMIGKVEKESWKDGRGESWVLTTKMPLRNQDGEIIGTFGISKDITAIKQTEAKLETVHRELVNASRQAGMAEVATSVLHNVGNVLNSVNVSTTLILETLRKSRLGNLGRLAAMIREHQDDLAAFFTTDPKGIQLPGYFSRLAEHLTAEQTEMLKEVELTRQHVEHIKDIVTMQQSYAKVSGVVEKVAVVDLVEDALRLNGSALVRHDVQVLRDFPDQPIEINVERQKVLQILVNLIRNAKYACDDSGRKEKRLTMQVRHGDGRVHIAVMDNGVGIPAENLTRIFNHGFTTRKKGHGFGLHSGALAAKELGGTLSVHSDGPDCGATFTLELPVQPKSPPA